jgi:hypothetical protein
VNYTTATVPVDFSTNGEEKIENCDNYLGARTGRYEWRAIRYRAALGAMQKIGLADTDTVFDIGAGWTEFDFCLRTEFNSRCRYIPVDGCMDGVQLDEWIPPRKAEWFVVLELIEHLADPWRLVREMQGRASKGIIISTPNTDNLGHKAVVDMDSTHVFPIYQHELTWRGFQVFPSSFYGADNDSILGVWAA